jgi:hypothetical protein
MHSILQFMEYLFYSLHIYHNQPWKLLFWLTSSFFINWLKMIELELSRPNSNPSRTRRTRTFEFGACLVRISAPGIRTVSFELGNYQSFPSIIINRNTYIYVSNLPRIMIFKAILNRFCAFSSCKLHFLHNIQTSYKRIVFFS